MRSGLVAVMVGVTLLGFGAARALWTGAARAASPPATFGKTNVGASSDSFAADRKRVSRYALPAAGAVSELSIYLAPTSTSGQQLLKGVLYADSGGAPGKLLGASTQLTFTSTSAAGWYRLAFSTPLQLAAGEYWIGVITGASKYVAGYRYDSVTGARDYNANTYTSGASDPFGSFTKDNQQMSLYATYTAAPPPRPVNLSVPAISGLAQSGQQLTASPGSWSNSPTSYEYSWQRCDAQGANCGPTGVTSPTYALGAGDLNSTLRVSVTAINGGGPSEAATSLQTAPVTAPAPPENVIAPTISGTAQSGQTLIAGPGAWSGSPTSNTYQWQRCDSQGESCESIETATSSSYTVVPLDVSHTLRVSVTAINGAGPSVAPAISAPSAVVGAAASVQHLEYVFVDGLISVYDMDQGQNLVKTVSLPQTLAGIRGTTVSPSTHMLFISYGGDGGSNGNGSVLAYDLVAEKVVWTVHLNTGIDSGQVSPDGKRLYMPTGESTSSGIWNILDTSNGAVIGTIQGGSGAHNTIVSNDGRYVYMAGRYYNYLDVYDTTTGQVRPIGPLVGGARPFTVNGSNTLAFTTSTGFLGFQVSNITTGKVLFTVSFGAIPSGFPLTAPSHGASLSPDEKQLYVSDAVHKEVQVYDVSRVAEGVAPIQLGVVPAVNLNVGSMSPCVYDCARGGWVQHSLDGRFVYVGTSGEVIETATRKVITTLPTLMNTKKSLEIDWANGMPVATSGRTGVGLVG